MGVEEFKKALNDGDVEKSSKLLEEIFLKDPENFRKSLLLSNSLPEPLDRDFKDKKLETLIGAFIFAGKDIASKNTNIIKYMEEFIQITKAIQIINKNSKSNFKRLMKNKYLEFSISEQLQMFCIFLEDQHRLSQSEIYKFDKKTKYITGMESDVAKFSVDKMENIKTSATDNFETLINVADTLFRLLYYKAKDSIEANDNFEHKGITPYNLGSFEEIIQLALQRNLFVNLWGKFKYRNWKLEIEKENDIDMYYFVPDSLENFKKEQIAVNRYIYRDFINFQQDNMKTMKDNDDSANCISDIASKINHDIKLLFSIEKKDFLKASKFSRSTIESYAKSIDDVYLSAKFDGIEVHKVLDGFEYLFTIAIIYQESVLKNFNQDDKSQYKNLAPIVDKELFVNHFANVYELSREYAEKIINLFVFLPKPILDVFSQPLIYVGKNKVILCPMLIMQMNVVRIIEMYMTEWNINISQKGTEFEKKLRFILSFNPYIKVNSNKIEFKAYDGRDVEFDFIGQFGEHLLLIEFKHLKIPFSDKTKKNSEDIIDYGIEQVNRRVEILKNNWDEVKTRCSFELPDQPFEEDKIIKLVCTNIFDFTGIVKNGVSIIDSSSLLKFFMAPHVDAISVGKKVKKVSTQKLWDKEYPTVEEFKMFLREPIAVKPYINCFEPTYKPIVRIEEEDYNICFLDYILKENPYEKLILDDSNDNYKIKVGRNDPCPCNSGKKYKKCCGR